MAFTFLQLGLSHCPPATNKHLIQTTNLATRNPNSDLEAIPTPHSGIKYLPTWIHSRQRTSLRLLPSNETVSCALCIERGGVGCRLGPVAESGANNICTPPSTTARNHYVVLSPPIAADIFIFGRLTSSPLLNLCLFFSHSLLNSYAEII